MLLACLEATSTGIYSCVPVHIACRRLQAWQLWCTLQTWGCLGVAMPRGRGTLCPRREPPLIVLELAPAVAGKAASLLLRPLSRQPAPGGGAWCGKGCVTRALRVAVGSYGAWAASATRVTVPVHLPLPLPFAMSPGLLQLAACELSCSLLAEGMTTSRAVALDRTNGWSSSRAVDPHACPLVSGIHH